MKTTLLKNWVQPNTKEEETRLRDAGFRWGKKGTHTSRTIMLDELQALLTSCRPDATPEEYVSAIIEDNCLGKRTLATRRLSLQRLSELYALDPKVLLFRIMRHFWYADHSGKKILALLLALARDPLLRATANTVVVMRPGEELARQPMLDALNRTAGGRFNEGTLNKIMRNAASSWTQTGHLKGRSHKIRQSVTTTAFTTAYALLLGYLTGTRGSTLFETPWAQVLVTPPNELINLAMDARRLGLIDMSQAGGVVEVAFPRLMVPDEGR